MDITSDITAAEKSKLNFKKFQDVFSGLETCTKVKSKFKKMQHQYLDRNL